jgi:hypothetical protein
MMKRLSLLLAALFVAATLFAAPVIASANGDNDNNNDKVCVLRHEDDNGKDYHWVWDVEDLRVGDKVVKDNYCEDDHNDNGNGDHNGNHDDHNGDEG